MKKQLIFILLFPLLLSAQTYPFTQGFEGLVSSQPPPGWGGTMKVLLDHGRFDSKGLAARVSSAVPVDSSITPAIGPLTSATFLSFYYRIVDYAFYPNTETYLDTGDKVEILVSTDAVNYDVIYLIDMDTHNATTNFVKKKVFVTQHPGSTAYFKIRCSFGTGSSYYVDFDTIVVANDPQLGIEDVSDREYLSISPNPCSSIVNVQWQMNNTDKAELKIFNSLGTKIFEDNLTANYQLPTSNFPNGIYFVQLSDETRKINRKFLVQH